MNAKAAKYANPQPSSHAGHHRALAHLFTEYVQARNESTIAADRVARFEETIRLLINDLPREDQAEFARRFDELRSGVSSSSRGGEVFSNVVALFQKDHRPVWSVHDIQAALEKSGAIPEQKALYNAINYLAKTGRLRRISRGRYIIANLGVSIEHADIEDGTAPGCEHNN